MKNVAWTIARRGGGVVSGVSDNTDKPYKF